jgi:hypothetical protein
MLRGGGCLKNFNRNPGAKRERVEGEKEVGKEEVRE